MGRRRDDAPPPTHHRHPPPLQKNFGRPVEWGLVQDHAWSTPQLRQLEVALDVDGKPWPLGADGKPVVK